VGGILHVEKGLDVFDEADDQNAKGAEKPDEKHRLKGTGNHSDQKIHEEGMLFDSGDAEQSENRDGEFGIGPQGQGELQLC